jgi:hypothetical protein
LSRLLTRRNRHSFYLPSKAKGFIRRQGGAKPYIVRYAELIPNSIEQHEDATVHGLNEDRARLNNDDAPVAQVGVACPFS